MIVQDGKMTVQKGAILGNIKNISVANWKIVRDSLKTNGNITIEDFEATSPSMAAAIILGYNSNGWTVWKNSDGDFIDIYRSHINIQSE